MTIWCDFSGGDGARGVHVAQLTCQTGSVTWYNPTGALRLEVKPQRSTQFTACFVVESGDVQLKLSQESDVIINAGAPTERSNHVMNDHNLKTLYMGKGRSKELCMSATAPVTLYLESEVSAILGMRKVSLQYDISEYRTPEEDTSIEGNLMCRLIDLFAFKDTTDGVITNKIHIALIGLS